VPPPQKKILTLGLKCRLLVHSERYFLQFSYLLYKQETLLFGLQNLLLQPACNAQHRHSKRRQAQAFWEVEAFYKQPLQYSCGPSYAVGLVIILIYWRKKLAGRQRGPCPPAPGWIRHCTYLRRFLKRLKYSQNFIELQKSLYSLPLPIHVHRPTPFTLFSVLFTARRYASAVLAVIVCLSVRPSVCLSVCPSVRPSQVGVVQRWLTL